MSNDPTVITSSTKASLADGVIGSVSKKNSSKPLSIQNPMATLTIQTQNQNPPSSTINDVSKLNIVQSSNFVEQIMIKLMKKLKQRNTSFPLWDLNPQSRFRLDFLSYFFHL